jgi:hypothetical protein
MTPSGRVSRKCRASPWHSPRHYVSLSVGWVSNRRVDGNDRVLTFEFNTNSVGRAPDSPFPNGLVEPWVDPYISGAHLSLGKGDDRFHCGGSTLLERTTVHKLVKMYGVFACHYVLKCGPCLSLYDGWG